MQCRTQNLLDPLYARVRSGFHHIAGQAWSQHRRVCVIHYTCNTVQAVVEGGPVIVAPHILIINYPQVIGSIGYLPCPIAPRRIGDIHVHNLDQATFVLFTAGIKGRNHHGRRRISRIAVDDYRGEIFQPGVGIIPIRLLIHRTGNRH